MKKPRLGINDWGTDDRGDEQGFFNSWVLVMRGTPITEATYHFRAAIGLSRSRSGAQVAPLIFVVRWGSHRPIACNRGYWYSVKCPRF